MICIDSIVNPAMCLMVCMHERDYIIVIIKHDEVIESQILQNPNLFVNDEALV